MTKNSMKNNLKAFTLVEIMLWVLIFTMVITAWFYALSAINYWKVKLIEETSITKEAFFFSQKLFEEVKMWWTLDYEEYFNRKVVWTLSTSSGHYSQETWYWNFWINWTFFPTLSYGAWFYYCNNVVLNNWCYLSNNSKPQRFWQYAFQFIDYKNSIRWDDDDDYLWDWPEAFSVWSDAKELYLISWDKKSRIYFRWNWVQDPKKPTSVTACWNTSYSSWCLWTVEFLKLDWKDRWVNHSKSWPWAYDWIIDTWVIDPDFTWWSEVIYWSNSTNYRQKMFPDTMSVKEFKIFPYPSKDKELAWKSSDPKVNINPYVKIQLTLTPSRKKRASMKWTVPDIKIATTVNLTDYLYK